MSRWNSGWDVELAQDAAWRRITDGPFFTPTIEAGFKIERTDRIFAIGSCFAREVETHLRNLGFNIDSYPDSQTFGDYEEPNPRYPARQFLNKYNPESIYQEL